MYSGSPTDPTNPTGPTQPQQLVQALSAYGDQLHLQKAAAEGTAGTYLQKQLTQTLDPVRKRQSYGTVPLAPHDAFTTSLDHADELKFQDWRNTWAPRDSGADYDLRGAYKEGLLPSPDKGQGPHWSDRYKKPNHETYSVESVYAAEHGNPGTWTGKAGDIYVPGQKPSPVSMNPFAGGFNSPAGKAITNAFGLMKRGSESLKGVLAGSVSQPVDESVSPPAKSPAMGRTRNVDQNRQLEQLRREEP